MRAARRSRWAIAHAMLALCMAAATPHAQEGKKRAELWDIRLGARALDLPDESFSEFACGTNGGPPSIRLSRFADFAKCRPDGQGLHEVYFRYDDELEYWARAHGHASLADHFGGTRISVHPAIVSALFDGSGVVRRLRAVTDDRVPLHARSAAYRMADEVRSGYGDTGWTCADLPPDDGEEPAGTEFVKRVCEKLAPEGRVRAETHLFRKAGQHEIDPHTGALQRGQFKSWSKVELTDPAYTPGASDPIPATAPAPSVSAAVREDAFRAGVTKDCPGCDLRNANLRFRDLSGANLAGAVLSGANLFGSRLTRANCVGCDLAGARLKRVDATGANFTRAALGEAILHAAVLRDADFTGADLSRANLNRVQAIRTVFSGAKLNEAMLFTGDVSGADLSGADLAGALAGRARMRQARLASARLTETDLSEADLTGAALPGAKLDGAFLEKANLRGAKLPGASLRDARLLWSDLRDADLAGAMLADANLYKADLRGANLRGADLTDSVLHRAFMEAALLDDARLKGAKMPDGDVHN